MRKNGEQREVSAQLRASVEFQQSISCLGLLQEAATCGALQQQKQRCLLGFAGGAVAWAGSNSRSGFCQWVQRFRAATISSANCCCCHFALLLQALALS